MEEVGMRYHDKVAFVTGGGRGIGRATVERLAREGAKVAVMELSPEAAHAVVDPLGGQGLALTGNATNESDIAACVHAAVARFGAIDVLVNNAAALTLKATLREMAPADWDQEFEGTLRGAMMVSRAVLPGMIERKRGAIVHVGSVNGLMYFGHPAYSAAKAGLLSLTRSQAVEYGPHGVRVNMVSPGSVRTEAHSWTVRLQRDPQLFEKLARWYPVGRVGRPTTSRPRSPFSRPTRQHSSVALTWWWTAA